jgi:uncharacterized membrane protein
MVSLERGILRLAYSLVYGIIYLLFPTQNRGFDMLQILDTVNKALLWTTFAGLAFVVWIQVRARLQKHDLLSSFLIGEHLVSSQVVSALLITCLLIGGSELFFLPTIWVAHAAPVQPDPASVNGYSLPDANVSVVQVQGEVTQQPASGLGEWRIGGYTFSTDAQTTIQVSPNQPVIACLVQHDGEGWKATEIVPASQTPPC